jgi:hypothetical protein
LIGITDPFLISGESVLSRLFSARIVWQFTSFAAGFSGNCAETARAIALSPVIRPGWR